MTLLARIKIDPAICHGEPSVGKYTVQSLLEHRRAGRTYEELLAHYEDLFPNDILAAEAYHSVLQYQGSLTIRELIEQVRPCFAALDYEWTFGIIQNELHATGPQNHHLALPCGKRPWQLLKRSSPLSLDAPVYGQFLTLSWCSHDGLLFLEEHIDRQELEDEIVGGGGICNDYVNCLAAVENGVHRPYRIRYTSRLVERKVLNKRKPEALRQDDKLFAELDNDVQIEWLENSQ